MEKYIDKISPGNMLAIVVIYDLDIAASKTIISLEKDLQSIDQHLDLVVYDNSRLPQPVPVFKKMRIVKYIHDPSNPGVSKAYNLGAEFAASIGKNWVLLLDQDTLFDSGIMIAYLDSVHLNPGIHMFCPIIRLGNGTIFSPFRVSFKRGFALKEVVPNQYPLHKFSPVNSGILIRLTSFLAVGGYNEKIKMDFSDLQFSERFRSQHNFFQVVNGRAIQGFSNDETDSTKLNRRFKLYCESARNCDKFTLGDHLQYFLVVFGRATVLMLRTRNPIFLKTFFFTYLLRSQGI